MSSDGKTLRAGIYGRESKGKAKSVDDQIDIGTDVISANGWTFAGSYDDGTSASRFATTARADWQRLMVDLAEGKLDVLIVWEIARGSREPVDGFTWLNLCRDHRVLVHVINDEETYDPRKTRHYDTLGRALLDGAKESNTTSDRVSRGVAKSAAAGKPHGGHTPYGFQRHRWTERDENGKLVQLVKQTADPERSPIVREVFERVAKHDTITSIVRDFNAQGVPTAAGASRGWTPTTVKKMIRKPCYMGKRGHRGAIYDGQWDGIVGEKLWRDANAVLDLPGRKWGTGGAGPRRWLLSYFAVGACGGPLHVAPRREGRKFPSYRCLEDVCGLIGQPEMDEYITRLVVARLSREDAADLFLADDDSAGQAQAEAAALRVKLDEARESYAKPDGISAASLASIEQRLEPMIADAERRRLAASVPSVVADVVTSGTPRKTFDGLPLAGKRTVIATLFSRIALTRPDRTLPRISRWSTFADRLEHAAARVETTWRQP